jgi:hypothetical protein
MFCFVNVLQVCSDVKERARATGFSLLGDDVQEIGLASNSVNKGKNQSIVRVFLFSFH